MPGLTFGISQNNDTRSKESKGETNLWEKRKRELVGEQSRKQGWGGVEGGTQTAGEQPWREEGAGNGWMCQLEVPVGREGGAK